MISGLCCAPQLDIRGFTSFLQEADSKRLGVSNPPRSLSLARLHDDAQTETVLHVRPIAASALCDTLSADSQQAMTYSPIDLDWLKSERGSVASREGHDFG